MIRTRLTLWNAAVFAIALTLIGAVVYVTLRTGLYRSIDQELSRRGEFMKSGPFGGPGRHGPDGPPPDDRHGPPDFDHGPSDHGPSDRHFEDHGPRMNFLQLATELDPMEAKRVEFIFRLSMPRNFGPDGSPRGPHDDKPFDLAALRSGLTGRTEFTTLETEDHRIRVLTVPLRDKGRVVGVSQVAASLDDVDEILARLRTILLALLPLSLLATSLLGVWLTSRVLHPVLEIAEAAERIEATNLSGRLPVRGNDEFAILSRRFNSMLERIESAFQRLAQAYDAQRRFIADASHELKTPLTTVKGRVGVALAGSPSPERYAEHLRAIGRAADSMNAIIQDLLLLARADESQLRIRLTPYPLRRLALEAASAAVGGSPERIEIDVADDLTVAVDVALFTRALINVLGNAVRHTPAERRIVLRGRAEGGEVRIEVEDQGEGIPAEHLPLVFDRFHRVDASRDRSSGGTGLGLAIVRSIVEAHGGRISIASEVGRGTTVTIALPATEEP